MRKKKKESEKEGEKEGDALDVVVSAFPARCMLKDAGGTEEIYPH